MDTSWREIICNGAMVLIDDVRLGAALAESAPRFLRKMALYMDLALPMLNRPPELYSRLQGGLVRPAFDSMDWVSTEESTHEETVVDTGKLGYQLFSCLRREEEAGQVVLVPAPQVSYNPETGEATFPIQPEAGVGYELDFYTDGHFAGELTAAQKRLAALAVACVWDERFSRNWLNLQPKIKDSSFSVVSEASYMRAAAERLGRNRAAFFDELNKYEQDAAWNGAVPQSWRKPPLV